MVKKSKYFDFRSRSTEEETELSLEGSVQQFGEDQSLEDVLEDPESGDSETANEVEVSEKTLKFKISTECSIPTTGRKSYPGSRKGSRERGQHLNHTDLTRMMQQKGKLKVTAYSFDHHFMSDNKKLSVDTPSFLDEYALTLKKKFEEGLNHGNSPEENGNECVLSKETINLNKRNSEHSVKTGDDTSTNKKSILKCPPSLESKNNHVVGEGLRIHLNSEFPEEGKNKYKYSGQSENEISVISLKDEAKVQADGRPNKSSIFTKFRLQLTDRFGLSQDSKLKYSKNNNFSKSPPTHKPGKVCQ